ncbi:MAG: hypothetical protein ABEJ55_07740 [Halanaeroarchaeum sp.]
MVAGGWILERAVDVATSIVYGEFDVASALAADGAMTCQIGRLIDVASVG